jgi:N-acetylneuraminic acid mutarotase
MSRVLALVCGLLAVIATLIVARPAGARPPAAPAGPAATSAQVRALCPAPARTGQAACSAAVRTDIPGHLGVTPQQAPTGYGPADLRAAYQLPTATTTATVAVVTAFDDPSAEADLGVYRQQFGLPACTTANGCFAKLDQRGGTTYPETNSYWAGQVAMDLDVVSAICPTCQLRLVEADDTLIEHVGAAVNTAVGAGASTVVLGGTSYEEPDETTLDESYFDHPGVAIVAPAGDFGYSNGTGTPYPGVSPYVTSVGGTSLSRDPNTARGWTETAWAQSGSGCSAYEAKPAFQHDTGCAKTTAADVSADADPATGVAAYNSYQSGGWAVMGGTGGAAAIVGAVSALAGAPTGTAKSYPYAAPSALFDVTSGSTGFCDGSYMCTAGPGYDAPTGLGSPRGVVAFEAPDRRGDVAGTVTDSASGQPLAGASVSADGTTAVTDADGHYDLPLTVGRHPVVASSFGHNPVTASDVSVTAQATTTQDFTLAALPSVTLSGTVTDATAHHWPLYAKLTVRGMPGGIVYTDPVTGHYGIDVPQGVAETLDVTPVYAGYEGRAVDVAVGDGDTSADVALPVDAATCTAPGYAYEYGGLFEPFAASTAPAGWTVRDDNGSGGVWAFDDPGHRGNHTGGSGNFAVMDGDHAGIEKVKDTELVSPAVDLSSVSAPTLGFDTDLNNLGDSATADVDISLDGGTTWQNVWHEGENLRGPKVVLVDIPQAAGHSDVRARFHYTGQWDYWWAVDDVFVGTRTCAAQPGGLIVGTVTDQNTGDALSGADVAAGSSRGTSQADGRYWLFTPTGNQSITATDGRFYQARTATVAVPANYTARADLALAAGRLTISATSLTSTEVLGTSKSEQFTAKNTGSAPASISFAEHDGGFRQLAATPGAAVQNVAGTYSPLRAGAARAPTTVPQAAAQWQPVANYPIPIMDNSAAAGDGVIYSVGGIVSSGNPVANAYRYDPGSQTWSAIASMPRVRQKPAVAYIDGQLIVTGGWDLTGGTIPQTDVYDPATDTWTSGRAVPAAYAGSGVGVVDGRMYVVGGCTDICGETDAFAYDPSTDTWTTIAPYPRPVGWESCGGVAGKLYCTGGIGGTSSYQLTYAYDPATNKWTQVADLPIDLWGAGYAAVGDQFVVSGGITQNSHVLTNEGFGYDPTTNAWTPLPNSGYSTYRGGSACGFYKIGGTDGYFTPVQHGELLPGLDQCGGAGDLPWVSEDPASTVLAPGASTTVTVTFAADAVDVTQPGTESGTLTVGEDTPYRVPDIGLTMNVTAPKKWGKISGIVTGLSCAGAPTPLAGVTVQIDSFAGGISLLTDASGHYAYWLDSRLNPMTLIAALDGWQPQARTSRVRPGQTTEVDFALKPDAGCG